ncbi:MAG: DUF2950 domain-containing protein [Candidatus Binatus sp.]|uniref:DUF2950 domain-containing protein n=1 Tax=Candidatus Binatus sp. TaxID=2811406 RepID=UPI003D0C2A3B
MAIGITVEAEANLAALLRPTTPLPRAVAGAAALAAEAADMPAVAEAVITVVEEAPVMATNRRWQGKAMCQPINGDRISTTGRLALWVLSVSLVLGFGIDPAALAQEPGQKTFGSATEATNAFCAAVQNHDETAMLAILGPSGRDVISSGDPVADKTNQDAFVAKYRASHQFASAPDGLTFLYIGNENWPTPIPLQHNQTQWYFDTAYGKQEILYRRIGFNELDVIKVCAAIVDAQRDYFNALHDGASEHQYAAKFRSTAGTQDGLYWQVKGSQGESPLGPLVAEAASEGYQHTSQPHPFHGYMYRLLTSQGANAPGGAKSYIVAGKMTGGFALVAYPASYRDSGVMTFIVNQDGQVYQKDLGADTAQIALAMTAYDPDATWQPASKATVAASQ